jgi:Cu(I)/Ag(I) efflux system membrane fusion protein
VEATVEALPGRVFHGAVDLIHPHLEAGSRTIRVRMMVENPGHELLAGMSATVTVQTPVLEIEPFRTRLSENEKAAKLDDKALAALQKICPVTGLKLGEMGPPVRTELKGSPVLLCCKNCPPDFEEKADYYFARAYPISTAGVPAVPERAVIDTGEQKLVYVEREPGVFEGREVKLGPRSGGYYAVVEGVLPGDRVAAAGAFLIDAETRLNPAAAAAYFGASGGPEK